MHEVHSSECVACPEGDVHDGGVCRGSEACAKTDGTRCVACEPGSIPFYALTCVAEGDCVEFVDGACVRCKDNMFPEDGVCVTSGSCVTIGNGTCLRCADGMYADATEICKRRALFAMTRSV